MLFKIRDTIVCFVTIFAVTAGSEAQAATVTNGTSAMRGEAVPNSRFIEPRSSATKSWRVAQDVSEKEAFELAKDVNSLEVWQAYLIKFPHGFRAAIAKSYIRKLESSQTGGSSNQQNDQTEPSGDDDTIDYVRASELPGPFRLAARGMRGVYVNNTRPGLVTVVPNALDRRSGHWFFEQVPGTKFVRIRNSWKGTYLLLDGQSAQSHRRPRSDRSTHWTIERAADGSDHFVLRNRPRGRYLWTDEDDRFLYVANGQPEGPRGHWRFVSMEDTDTDRGYDDSDDDEPITRPIQPRITCINGYVKNGSCRCRSGRERVRTGRNKYRCNRVRISCSSGEYYSKSRKRCVCRKGHERVGSRCLRNEELDDDRGNTSCPAGFLLRKGYCVCPRGKKNIQGKCRRPKTGGGTVRPKIRCSKIKFAFSRGNTCKCSGGRVFTGRACVLRKGSKPKIKPGVCITLNGIQVCS